MAEYELDYVDRLVDAYYAKFGVRFAVPYPCMVSWTDEDTITEITYSLETGIPLDEISPRWVWGHCELKEGEVY